jgi:chemosensory pili system protein ChpA (sensor histidine kinase/response regulator)
MRVPAERIDALMNLAAELVVGRSRLLSRMSEIGRLRHGLRNTNARLHQSVEGFREEYEFANLDGRALAAPAALATAAAGRTPAALTAAAGRTPTALATAAAGRGLAPLATAAGGWGGFGELELDRYEDIHVFTRSLAEMTDDLSQLHGGLFEQLGQFAEDTEALGTVVSGLQTELTRARMVPLEGLFARLRLAARDAAEREGLSVRTHTTGEKVSLDKTIVDALYAPLLHLVRNAVTHGIEPSERRSAGGKPPNGVVSIAARQESGRIVIEVADDGAGLDLPALLDRGVAMGLVPPGTAPSDPRVPDLVFAAGLSTRAGAGSVSGRGVGGNVVRRAVERMNGAVTVRTQAGRGTIFEITLPLTLAITRALLVAHASRNYFVPLAFADRILDSSETSTVDSAGLRRVLVDDEYVVVRGLSGLLGLSPTARAGNGALVVLRFGDRRLALEVDGVAGQEEIVVKNLGELLHGHPLFAGVSIRGNGELALILDVPSLVDESRSESTEPAAFEVDLDASPVVPSRPRVLFVDDSLSVRKVAEKFLVALGAEVTLAVDGIDGLSRLRGGHFDLVFTDLEMPRLHGYELIREIRAVPALRKLPVVVVTSRSSQRHREQARAVGATDYVTKPFTQEALSAILDKLLLQRLGEDV